MDSKGNRIPPEYLVGESALKGMLAEVSCTPKPGLVDRNDPGANKDMDYCLFMFSSSVLGAGFSRFAQLGYQHEGPFPDLLQNVRELGKKIEKRMFRVTKGVNTQKGLLFLMGLICASAGSIINEGISLSPENICTRISQITEGIVERELFSLISKNRLSGLTRGEELFLEHGIRGIRGEVEDGLPSVLKYGLVYLKEALSRGMSMNDSGINALLGIMSQAEDTNIMSRSSPEYLENTVRKLASNALNAGGMGTTEGRGYILYLNDLFKRKNINPGGSADLLAVTFTLYFLSLPELESEIW
jgi:triphosphoribosyl-dephospho-CoA synthetase